MGVSRLSWFALTVLLVGCQVLGGGPGIDLRHNSDLYKSVRYSARMAADRVAFVTPLVDERTGNPITGESNAYPVDYVPDNVWPRPLIAMIEDILIDELTDSGVFRELCGEPPALDGQLIVQPVLMTARCGQEERPFGRRSFGEFGLKLVVYGPKPVDGARPVWIQEEFGEVTSTDVGAAPPSAPKLLGQAIHGAMYRLVSRLDQSNVARSGVPLKIEAMNASAPAEPGK